MDFAVGLQVGFIKNGAPRSGERIDKLNFLTVSYTHLDVYKRQLILQSSLPKMAVTLWPFPPILPLLQGM